MRSLALNSDETHPNELSISFWINPEANQLECAAILDKSHAHLSNNGKAKSWVIQSCAYGTNIFSLHFCNGDTCIKENNFTLNENDWKNITITKEDNQIIVYENGAFESLSEELFENIATNGNNPLLIGAVLNYVSSRAFNGKIDDVRIYNRALSESEVSELYSGGNCSLCSQEELDAQYEAGKQYCIDNPEACGWSGRFTQSDLDKARQEGYNSGCNDCSNGSSSPATISPELNLHIPYPSISKSLW